MADTARRMGQAHGSDVVRRLIARPIRMQATRQGRPAVAESPRFAEAAQAGAQEDASERAAISTEIASHTAADTEAAVLPNADRLRMEMQLMKAVLQAERRENESLRACIGFEDADAGLGAEAQAVRNRWAALVDRLLHAPA